MSEQDITQLNGRMKTLETKLDDISKLLTEYINTQAIKEAKQESKYHECLGKLKEEFVHKSEYKNKWHEVYREVKDDVGKSVHYIKNWIWIVQSVVYIAGIVFLYIVK